MAKVRGSKGSITLGANAMGNLQSWELDIARALIDGTAMGDSAQGGHGLDLPGGSGTMRMNFDGSNAAHAAIQNLLVGNDDTVTLAGVFTMDTGKTFSCSIVPTNMRVVSQRGQWVTADVSFVTDGAITPAWV